jgi:hypothetical protein
MVGAMSGPGRKQWRCFHCDDLFRSPHAAAIHFGSFMDAKPACLLPHEQHLVEHIRDLERQLDSYRDDRDQIMRAIVTLEGEHARALRDEEEKGYARGLRDALKLAGDNLS